MLLRREISLKFRMGTQRVSKREKERERELYSTSMIYSHSQTCILNFHADIYLPYFFFLPADVTINLHLLHLNRDSILHKIYLKQFLCVSYET